MPLETQNTPLEEILKNITAEPMRLEQDDVVALIRESLQQGEPFTTEFNKRVIIPLTQKIERSVRVSEVLVDGKKVGEQITQQLSDSTEKSVNQATQSIDKQFKDFAKSFDIPQIKIDVDADSLSEQLNDNISNGIDASTRDSFSKLSGTIKNRVEDIAKNLDKKKEVDFSINVNSLFGQTPQMSKLVSFRYQEVLWKMLGKIHKKLTSDVVEFDKEKPLQLKDLLGSNKQMGTIVNFRYQEILWKLLNKMDRATKGVEFKLAGVTEATPDKKAQMAVQLKDVFGIDRRTWWTTALRWNMLQEKIIGKAGRAINKTDFVFGNGTQHQVILNDFFGEGKDVAEEKTKQWLDLQDEIITKLKQTSKNLSSKDPFNFSTKTFSDISEDVKDVNMKFDESSNIDQGEGSSTGNYGSLLEDIQDVNLVSIDPALLTDLGLLFVSTTEKDKDKTKKKEDKEEGSGSGLMQGFMGGLGAKMVTGMVGKLGTILATAIPTLVGTIPIVLAAAVAAYFIKKAADETTQARNEVGEGLTRLSKQEGAVAETGRDEYQQAKEAYGSEFEEKWKKARRSVSAKAEMQKDPIQQSLIYRKAYRRIVDEIEKEKGIKKEEGIYQVKKKKETPQEILSTASASVSSQPQAQSDESDILKKLQEGNYEGEEESSREMAHDFIWRKGQPIQTIDEKDNLFGTNVGDQFDKLITALKNPKSDVTLTQPINSQPDSQIKELTTSIKEFIKYQSTKKEQITESTAQSFESLDGINENVSDVRDPAYILRGRVWGRITNRAYII